MSTTPLRNDATLRQIRAASPTASTWLSANAGSGKTRVLTDRVARLLLNGTEPQKVLCLTYTKAAATEMQNRLLKRLGEWAMLPDDALRQQLLDLGEEITIDAERLAEARRLFAKAIETPGGLKIQTIHSFCAALLRRFPLEAGVPHGFSEMDDRSGDLLRQSILEEIATGEDCPVLDGLVRYYSTDDLGGLLANIAGNKDGFAQDLTRDKILALYGLPPGFDAQALLDEVFDAHDLKTLRDLVAVMAKGAATDQKNALKLGLITAPDLEALAILEDVCLTGATAKAPFSAKIGTVPTKATQKAAGTAMDPFNELMERVEQARPLRLGLQAADRTEALQTFARVFLPKLEAAKAARGWLDFDDLIERAGRLLSDSTMAQWVLFRLDGGIDHILVDEAQDTSPSQWKVIERLADEFTAGEGARDETRTIFVVGDRKQSIYSFQGADLRAFEAMQRHFAQKFAAVGRPLQEAQLLHSFRSSAAVLGLTDVTFLGEANEGLGGAPEHIAFFDQMPGRVDLWPVVEKTETEQEETWENPVDLRTDTDPTVVLARTVAAEIRAMIDQGVRLPEGKESRPLHEGDILILVQRRGALFSEIIRACKAAGLAIAGADRLKLGAELAVKDIRSVLAFLATAEDDLALAEALKSPLFGWSEQDLYTLAQPRKGYLWEALRKSESHPETLRILQDLRDQADFLRPHDLIERLLTRHGGRERLIARLGVEAEDGIDELISQALAFERAEVPSLTGFLVWLDADDVEVKRQLAGAGRSIRVMTVHGSKGLEAPVVILPDTGKPHVKARPLNIYRLEDGTAAWAAPSADRSPEEADAQAANVARQTEEKMRLLYVAMTRAEKWLIVAAQGKIGEGDDSWYSMISTGLVQAGDRPATGHSPDLQSLGEIRRVQYGTWPEAGFKAGRVVETYPELPDWARLPALRPERPKRVLTPSDLGGAKALAGDLPGIFDEEAAKRRGRQIHMLLEHLPNWPEADWEDWARDLLLSGEDAAHETELPALMAEARAVLASPAMQPFLAPEALAEVELTATLDGELMHGIIDRLLVGPDLVQVLDYKSNQIVPADVAQTPLGLVRQLAAYRAMLRQIYPDRRIECGLLWTAQARIDWLGDAQIDAALRTESAS
ncbi:double-strand break repair helicase AddA [Thioclava sp. 'Guangxiensis']|uniref:double-strand break repair helicase AddA n=1 Tax=Thioclava sp. 'Guangxiensis' TaxID=3149044 RepID=UPI003877FD5D